jgi:hypothetical protein
MGFDWRRIAIAAFRRLLQGEGARITPASRSSDCWGETLGSTRETFGGDPRIFE